MTRDLAPDHPASELRGLMPQASNFCKDALRVDVLPLLAFTVFEDVRHFIIFLKFSFLW
jgi:hypothetical protein